MVVFEEDLVVVPAVECVEDELVVDFVLVDKVVLVVLQVVDSPFAVVVVVPEDVVTCVVEVFEVEVDWEAGGVYAGGVYAGDVLVVVAFVVDFDTGGV